MCLDLVRLHIEMLRCRYVLQRQLTTVSFIPAIWWASVLFYLVGKMCSSYGVFSMYVVAMEVFPTTSRNWLLNVANTVGRIGSVVAPQAPLLVR